MATKALCNAFCLLLCRKLDIPSYAKPIKLVTNEEMMLPLSFLYFGNIGGIKEITFVKIS